MLLEMFEKLEKYFVLFWASSITNFPLFLQNHSKEIENSFISFAEMGLYFLSFFQDSEIWTKEDCAISKEDRKVSVRNRGARNRKLREFVLK